MFAFIVINHIINRDSIYQITLGIMYVLYTINDIVNTSTMDEYRQSRSVMWLVTSPIMLLQYMTIHHISFWNMKLYWHILAQALYCFPSIRHIVFYPICIMEGIFLYNFIKLRHLPLTKLCLQVWISFSVMIMLEHYNIIPDYHTIIIFKMMDLMGKGIWLLNMSEPRLTEIMPNDLQSLRLMGGIQQFIKDFKDNNVLTGESLTHINHLSNLILKDIQIDTTDISASLLKMLLPYGLDKQYLMNINTPIPYRQVTVMMTDIVGYTGLALTYDETRIYKMLHDLYLRFDGQVSKVKGIQKIETIGDAYMAVGDLSTKYNENDIAEKMIDLAMELMNEVCLIQKASNIPIQIRVGISVGPVVIGTLGKMIPRMCVVGHTVNLASRLQSSAEANEIQISNEVYAKLSPSFRSKYSHEKREKVDLKHIGLMDTWVFPNACL